MKIIFDFKDRKSNPTDASKSFISHWMKNQGYSEEEILVVSPEKILERGADYFVLSSGLLIEATKLIDNKDLARHAKWSINVNKLQDLIKEHDKFTEIKGLYSISTPEDFGLKASQLKNPTLLNTKIQNTVNSILHAVLSNSKSVSVFGSKLKIQKVSNKEDGIYFSTMGKVRSINIAQIFHDNLKDKFEKANTQLNIDQINDVPVDKRILLITNEYQLLAYDWDLFEGLSYSYEELINNYQNIDEIWFQVEDNKGQFHHKIMYKRSLFLQFQDMNFTKMGEDDYRIFAKWFAALEKLDEDKKNSLIDALKIILEEKEPHDIFPDPGTRVEMVRYGRWLAENEKRDDAIWLVDQFMKDPNPMDPPTEDEENYGNELHQEIKEAEKADMHSIQTVKGHLAWTVQLLALKKDEYLVKSYERTQCVLRNTQHLYLILQWIFPLIEIANRRFWLQELSEKLYEDFRILSFELLKKYSAYPDIARSLVRIFHYYRNLTTKEVKVVLDSLFDADDFEALLVYFALYRDKHFKDEKYPESVKNYDPTYALEKLEEVVLSNNPDLIDLRSGVAWNIWKILSEDTDEFDRLSCWIDKFITTEYNSHLFHNFERIIEDYLDKRPDKCLEWFIKIVEAASQSIKGTPEPGREIWLSTHTGEILKKLAQEQPEQMVSVTENLYNLWLMNAYVGSINEIFSSYKHIKNKQLRANIKKHFRKLYEEMKEINPKLQEVTWD
ncbi:hypothetical protein KO465_03115 [Candidatus Micrarchaeota archaeon]|jgi:hypothetical protein|nr:hypothetical protein [Candidatus Micrarchaeota archaeon]